jgi:transcription elongation factor GreA
MEQINYITEEGLKKLKEDLDRLEKVERPMISKQIADARDKGDLSENAEYHAAKEEQGMIELRISKLKDQIAKSKIIDESKIDTSSVRILNKVKIKNLKTKASMEYYIVPESEANFKEGKISVNSPIAKALLGKQVGDKVEVQTPSGIIAFEVLKISV